MTKIDFWKLAERVRLELGDKIEFMALHPRLCEEDGERFMVNILKDGILFITPACKEMKQQKLQRDGFEKAGGPDGRSPLEASLHGTARHRHGLRIDQSRC